MKKKAFNFKRLSFKQYQPLKLLCIMFLIVKCMHPDDGDTQAPTAPANLRASNITTSSVDLQWDASTDNVGVTEYDIYKRDTLAGTTTNTAYTVGSLSAATDYSFFVFAKDAAGNISPHSNIMKVSTLSSTAGGRDTTGKPYFKSGSLIYTVLNETDVSVKAADTTISGHVSIPATVNPGALFDSAVFQVTEIAEEGFRDCKALTGIDIPASVKIIRNWAFNGCESLTDITMPAVKIIGGQAFFTCLKLTNISIPSATIIKYDAFFECKALTGIDIPASVTMIGETAFFICSSLIDVYVHWTDPSNIVNIKGKNSFLRISSSALLHIPEGMKSAYAARGWGKDFAEVVDDQ